MMRIWFKRNKIQKKFMWIQQLMSEKCIHRYKNKFDGKRISQYFEQIKKMFSKEKLVTNNKLNKSQYKGSSSFEIPRYRVFRRYGDLTLKQVREKTIQQSNLQMIKMEQGKKSFSVHKINVAVGFKKANDSNKIKNNLKIRRNSRSKQLLHYSPPKQSCSLLVFSKQREQLSPFANKIERFRTELLNKSLLIKNHHQTEILQKFQSDWPEQLDKNVIKYKLKGKTSTLKRNLCKNRLYNQKKSQDSHEDIKKNVQSKLLGNNTPGTLGPWIKEYENPQF